MDRKTYLKNYNREWLARRRAEWLEGRVCARCGSAEKLELDHIDPTKKTGHRIWSWRQERRDAELVKCQVLCKECHDDKTREQLLITHGVTAFRHGTQAMYSNHGCRCGMCKLFNRNKARKRRAASSTG